MLVKSLKCKDFSCFTKEWGGFDQFKPVSVIVGRNNTGKSRLIDLVEKLASTNLQKLDCEIFCSGELSERILEPLFAKHLCGGKFGPNYYDFHREESHWNRYGESNVGNHVRWKKSNGVVTLEDGFQLKYKGSDATGSTYDQNAIEAIRIGLETKYVESPVFGRTFRRIFADRDIRPELETPGLDLSFDGSGATNLIRRFINSSALDETIIQEELLAGLAQIFQSDGNFCGIEIRQHDVEESGPLKNFWEVFFREPSKGLISLSDSGSGLKTVILVLLNLIVMPAALDKPKDSFIFAFEELENNLHPALLRRLFRYLADYVDQHKCMIFLTTHSSVALDFFATKDNSQIISVEHDGTSAKTATLTVHFDRVSMVSKLGSRPSDLLQANGIVWLEGPSDRIYINRFIELFSDGELMEGRDYQCAYYGGSILAKSEFAAPESSEPSLNNLLRINNNIAVICDGDRTAAKGEKSELKERVTRIRDEVQAIDNSFIWITEAKELENYVPGNVWGCVYEVSDIPDPGKYDSFPSTKLTERNFVTSKLKRRSFDKCDFAAKAAPHLTKENLAPRFELEEKMTELVMTIRSWSAN